ncbi:concanavalin A-like lectin/glucanase domain-containing protein [Chytridium lagenaria]|nr:concanavalin A-like lectin/glucanase domain-containing protein [Chytridium lagenaria]
MSIQSLAFPLLVFINAIAINAVELLPPAQCSTSSFDPQAYVCLTLPGTIHSVICPKSSPNACGVSVGTFGCYDNTLFCCVGGRIWELASTVCGKLKIEPPALSSPSTSIKAPSAAKSTIGTPRTFQCIPPNSSASRNFCVAFQDDFHFLDFTKWKHDITMRGGGNWEFQWYTNDRRNSYVKDSVLYIKPTFTADVIGAPAVTSGHTENLWGTPVDGNTCTDNADNGCIRHSDGTYIINPIRSALLRSVDSFSFRYGKVEVVAQLPKGDWIWPAIWLLPKYGVYGQWPASGEIVHWGPDFLLNRFNQTTASFNLSSGSFSDGLHTFGMTWTPESIITYIDTPSNILLNVSLTDFYGKGAFPPTVLNPWAGGCPQAPFDQEFYLILNVAVGGTNGYFRSGTPWNNKSPTAAKEFWDARDGWGKTWKGEDTALKVHQVTIWEMC